MKLRLVCAFALLVPPALVLAQNGEAPVATPAAEAAPKSGEAGMVTIRNSKQGTTTYDDATGIVRITKDVVVTQGGEDFILYAQVVTYNRVKNQAVATGDLRVETRDSTIKGVRMFADFNTKRITIEESVVISAHGKNDGVNGGTGLRAELQSKPVRIACNRLDFDYDIRQATLIGNIRMVQGDNIGTCERIVYDEQRNIANLLGRVRFADSKKRTLTGSDFTVYINEDRVETKKGAIASFDSNESANRNATPAPTKTKAEFPASEGISDEALKLFDRTPAPIPPLATPTEEAAATTPAPAAAQ